MTRSQSPISASGYSAGFAQRLRTARESAALTAAQAATAAGITYAAWLRYESGQRMPRLDCLQAVAAAVGAKPADLL